MATGLAIMGFGGGALIAAPLSDKLLDTLGDQPAVNERFHEPAERHARFERAEGLPAAAATERSQDMDAFATRAIFLWLLVGLALAYGVINTINQVVDLFS
jgi:hypothetical protein